MKELREKAHQTNLALLKRLESLFQSLAASKEWIEDERAASVGVLLQELADTICREKNLFEAWLADLSDASVAM